MITNFINKLLGKSPSVSKPKKVANPFGHKVELSAQEHGINPELVDSRAYDVVHTLKRAGYDEHLLLADDLELYMWFMVVAANMKW